MKLYVALRRWILDNKGMEDEEYVEILRKRIYEMAFEKTNGESDKRRLMPPRNENDVVDKNGVVAISGEYYEKHSNKVNDSNQSINKTQTIVKLEKSHIAPQNNVNDSNSNNLSKAALLSNSSFANKSDSIPNAKSAKSEDIYKKG